MSKLCSLGIHGSFLKWCQDFLNDRHQAVKIKNFVSSLIPVTSGVPQGRHLSPIFFNSYINDLRHYIACTFCAFADDLKMYRIVNCLNDTVELQHDLDELVQWCKDNHLSLNIDKCKIITFTRKHNPIQCTYTVDSATLERV